MNNKEQFIQDGYLHLKGILNLDTVEAFKNDIRNYADDFLINLYKQKKIEDLKSDLPFETRLFKVGGDEALKLGRGGFGRSCFLTKALFDLHKDEGLLSVLRELLGPNICALPSFNVRPKMPSQDSTNTPWHQDAGYFPQAEGCTFFTCWLPLVPVDHQMGCMQVIRKSHQWPIHKHFEGKNAGRFLEVSDFDIVPEDHLTIEMQPGDALVFNQNTMHRSTPNLTEKIRWNIDIRYGIKEEFKDEDSGIKWGNENKEWIVCGENITEFSDWEKNYLTGPHIR
jgi:phytanoyl-CoA hydroxylase